VLSLTGVGETPPVVTDINEGLNFNCLISISVTGSATYSTYFTQQDPFSSITAWTKLISISDSSVSSSYYLDFPVRAIKFSIDSGVGSCVFTVEEMNT
jgi:hypothetical protein